jgi:hypothetical protein
LGYLRFLIRRRAPSAANPAESLKSSHEDIKTETDLAVAISREHIWSEIEHWSFLVVVVALAIEFAALKLGAPYKKQIEEAKDRQITAANKKVEDLRRQNLELEEAVSPRILEINAPAKELKQYAGAEVGVFTIPEYESRRLAGSILAAFERAEWKKPIPYWFR